MNGLINVYKETGWTSHDVVAKLRRVLGIKRIGHTGTLDPMATGVLPVCVGRATKVCDFLTNETKSYRATLLLGMETDTQDVTGEILEEKTTENLSEERVRETIMGFVGLSHQIPPMYSACKIRGRKLYEYARAGREVEREPRAIMIYDIRILDVELPRVTFEVDCAKGTYIRTLCHDIGNALGTGGVMETLERTRVGMFCAQNAVTIDEIEKGNYELIPIDSLFPTLPEILIPEKLNKLLYNGCVLPGELTGQVRIYDQERCFIGIYEGDGKHYKPVTIFADLNEKHGTDHNKK